MMMTENLKYKLAPLVSSALAKDSLNLIIFPTEKCNFRCTYCYEDFSIGRMSSAVQKSLKIFMERRAPRLRRLSLSWFGGEPLVAKNIVKDMSAYGKELAKQYNFANFSGDITTNGYLLDDELFSQLLQLDQRGYQISLDGYGEGHDVTRKAASGGGTFDTVWSNLLATKQHDEQFSILIRAHISPDNSDSIDELVHQIAHRFRGDRRYRVFLKPIGNYGGPNSSSIRILSYAELAKLTPKWQAILNEAEIPNWSDSPGAAESDTGGFVVRATRNAANAKDEIEIGAAPAESEASVYMCYAAKPNSLVIRADGSIAKCTVALYDPRNSVGRLTEDGSIELNGNMGLWLRGLKTLDLKELGCPAQNLPKTVAPLKQFINKEQAIQQSATNRLSW